MTEEPVRAITPLDRPLAYEEADLLRWLLAHGFRDAGEFLPQVERLTVIGKCSCGCPTIYFAIDGVPVKRRGEQLISDHLAEVEGMPVGVMVFQTGGSISSLEVYSLPGSDKPFGLPAIDSILGPESSE
jgi:hypothetical protein